MPDGGHPEAAHSFDAANLPMQTQTFPKLRDSGFPPIGTHEAARKDSILRVSDFLDEHLAQ
jgi:hypothetical protein